MTWKPSAQYLAEFPNDKLIQKAGIETGEGWLQKYDPRQPRDEQGRWADWPKSWHLTDDPDFAFDPKKHPYENYVLGGPSKEPGLYVSDDPEYWVQAHQYLRPYIAEVEHPDASDHYQGYPQGFIPATSFENSRVTRVIPYDEHVREKYREPGPIEEFLGEAPKSIPANYRYKGSDVRDMTPEQRKRLELAARAYLAFNMPEALMSDADRISVDSEVAARKRIRRLGERLLEQVRAIKKDKGWCPSIQYLREFPDAELAQKFDPHQPRDRLGRWAEVPGSGPFLIEGKPTKADIDRAIDEGRLHRVAFGSGGSRRGGGRRGSFFEEHYKIRTDDPDPFERNVEVDKRDLPKDIVWEYDREQEWDVARRRGNANGPENGWDTGVFFHVTRSDVGGRVRPGQGETFGKPVEQGAVYLWPTREAAEQWIDYLKQRGVTDEAKIVPVHADQAYLEPDPEPFYNLLNNYMGDQERGTHHETEFGYAALDEARHFPDPVNRPEGETLREYLQRMGITIWRPSSPHEATPERIQADPWAESREILGTMPIELRRDVARVFSELGLSVLARGERAVVGVE